MKTFNAWRADAESKCYQYTVKTFNAWRADAESKRYEYTFAAPVRIRVGQTTKGFSKDRPVRGNNRLMAHYATKIIDTFTGGVVKDR